MQRLHRFLLRRIGFGDNSGSAVASDGARKITAAGLFGLHCSARAVLFRLHCSAAGSVVPVALFCSGCVVLVALFCSECVVVVALFCSDCVVPLGLCCSFAPVGIDRASWSIFFCPLVRLKGLRGTAGPRAPPQDVEVAAPRQGGRF
jgi:hypothetical protein